MPGSDNNVQYSQGYRLEPSSSEDILLMQETNSVSEINGTGTPEGVVSANPASIFHDRSSGNIYSKQTGTGNTGWVLMGVPATVADQYTTDNGIATPASSNLNVTGQQAGTVPVMFTTGAADDLTIEDRSWLTQYVVDPSATVGLRGTFQTIQAAINAATAPATIYLRNTTYTENLTLLPNINLVGVDGATVIGNHTFSPPGSDYNIILDNINFTASSGSTITVVGFATPKIKNCNIINTNGIGITVGTVSTLVDNSSIRSFTTNSVSGLGSIGATNSKFTGTVNISGVLGCSNSNFGNITTGSLNADNCVFGTLTIDSAGSLRNSYSSQITINAGILDVINTTVDGNIGGAGTVRFGAVIFENNNPVIFATGQQLPRIASNDGMFLKTPGAYPYQALGQDSVVLVDASAARTILLPGTTVNGATIIVKDNTGQAATNPINIQAFSGNIDGAIASTINVNWGAKRFVRTSTQWVTI